jgi:hypothetical protein
MNTITSEADTTAGFTVRTLLSLVSEMAIAQASVESIEAQIEALAELHGVKMVDPEAI